MLYDYLCYITLLYDLMLSDLMIYLHLYNLVTY